MLNKNGVKYIECKGVFFLEWHDGIYKNFTNKIKMYNQVWSHTFNGHRESCFWAITQFIRRNTAISSLVLFLDTNKSKYTCAGRADQIVVAVKFIFCWGIGTGCTGEHYEFPFLCWLHRTTEQSVCGFVWRIKLHNKKNNNENSFSLGTSKLLIYSWRN